MKPIRVHRSDGTSYETCVNEKITQQELEAYFLNQWFTESDEVTKWKCIKVEFI